MGTVGFPSVKHSPTFAESALMGTSSFELLYHWFGLKSDMIPDAGLAHLYIGPKLPARPSAESSTRRLRLSKAGCAPVRAPVPPDAPDCQVLDLMCVSCSRFTRTSRADAVWHCTRGSPR